MAILPKYRNAKVGAVLRTDVTTRADGVQYLTCPEPLGEYPARLTDRLEFWAAQDPGRLLVAKRINGRHWQRITYGEMLRRAQAVGEALLQRQLSEERPLVILSGNDIDHLILAMGALWAGVPHAPVSTAYSLVSRDFGKLGHVMNLLTPGMVYAAEGDAYAAAIKATVPAHTEVVLGNGALVHRATTPFVRLLEAVPSTQLQRAHQSVGPDTVAKFLFTSGSTKMPKAVTHTQRMLCSNQQMIRQALAFLAEEPPVLVDWLPWSHTFGGNHNVGIVIYNGGTLYIDEGRPTSHDMAETLRNLREISPTVYFNVPKGFEEIVRAMEFDVNLRHALFAKLRAFFFASAGLSQDVWDRLDQLAEATVGERIPMLTGLGMTETSPASTFAVRTDISSGHIGVPVPGVEAKLVPRDGKLEIRFRGPHVMPGYWRAADLTREVFDDEGYYCTGDAVKFVDPDDPQRGLFFDGRLAEDFKLSSGTFVSVGPLRARIIAAGAPYIQDVVIAGIDRNEVGILIFPQLDECLQLAAAEAATTDENILRGSALKTWLQHLIDRLWAEGSGTSTRVGRALWLIEPPSIDHGEATDKSSISQRAVLARRAALVKALYDGSDPHVIIASSPNTMRPTQS